MFAFLYLSTENSNELLAEQNALLNGINKLYLCLLLCFSYYLKASLV